MHTIIKGNIFNTECSAIVNTVNCVGVMGAGIAFEFRLRYPDMYKEYVKLCKRGEIKIGHLWIYKPRIGSKLVVNFPTKYHWKYPSKKEYIEKGLKYFVDNYRTYQEKYEMDSIAFPILGADRGKIPQEESLHVMEKYFKKIKDLKIEIYIFDPLEYDDLFLEFKNKLKKIDDWKLSHFTGIRIDYIRKLRKSIDYYDIRRLSALINIKGIGINTVEKIFKFIMHNKGENLDDNTNNPPQLPFS